MKRILLGVALCLLLGTPPVSAAVFQYAAPVATSKGESTAFLWIPPEATRLRGAIISGMTLMEREMAKDACIRESCAGESLAIVFLKCGLGSVDVQRVLDDLADVSNYHELSTAPLMFVGHSAGGPQAKALAGRMHARCFGLVQYRGGSPGGHDPLPPGVPALMMVGQFDEFGGVMRDESGRENWEGSRDALAVFRAADERNLGSIVVEPGAGHFAWSDRNAAYLALFIRKAAQARIPADGKAPLLEIDPRIGWLTDLTVKSLEDSRCAAFEEYQGERTKAAWHFDREMAQATIDYHAGGFCKQDQFIRWNDPHWVDAGARFFFTQLKWIGDGQTFEVHPVFADKYPSQYNGRGPRWLEAGKRVGHATAPILVKQVSGPVVTLGANTLRIQYDALAPATESSRVTFMAYSEGDDRYRYTEHVGMMPRGFKGLRKGKEQTITFPAPDRIRAGGNPVVLRATSDSGLPVEYHIAYGPAIVCEGRLQAAELPVRAVYPVPVKVVAYQFGSGVEPLTKTAAPVERTVLIEKP